jgi:hypothetical protein
METTNVPTVPSMAPKVNHILRNLKNKKGYLCFKDWFTMVGLRAQRQKSPFVPPSKFVQHSVEKFCFQRNITEIKTRKKEAKK